MLLSASIIKLVTIASCYGHEPETFQDLEYWNTQLLGVPCSSTALVLTISGDWHPSQSVSSVAQLSPTLCNPMDCSTPGFPVHHQLLELTQTRVCWVSDAIQPSHPLLSPFPPAFSLSQHQGFFQWVGSSHQVAKVLELQLQHQSFQWMFRVDFL